MIRIRGVARVDRQTKQLVNRILPGEIAVICHRDLDGPAAQALIRRRVGAVINAEPSISGRYPNLGPDLLLGLAIERQAACETLPFLRTVEDAGDLVQVADVVSLEAGLLQRIE